MGICAHNDEPHTIWYWIDDLNDIAPVPYVAKFDNRKDAVRQAESWLKEAPPSLRWMKIFRSDNETYTCWRWQNPNSPNKEQAGIVEFPVTQARKHGKSTLWQRLMGRKHN